MRRVWVVVGTMVFVVSLVSCASDGGRVSKTKLETFSEKSSYALGMDFGAYVNRMQTDVDVPSLIQGIRDTIEGKEALLSQEEMAEIMQQFTEKMQAESADRRKVLGEKNLTESEAFLAENKSKEGVITTESGLQYLVLTQGDGPKPKASDRVTVHYVGTLRDGTEFDSSYKLGEPATFGLGAVIPGWTEGLQLMPVGSKYRLFIPPALGYGERGAGQVIGPNEVLIFEVELLGIEK